MQEVYVPLTFRPTGCLRTLGKNVLEHMVALIDQYFVTHLELSLADAEKLHTEYYTNYGLAIEGLVRHHKIDVLEYNRQVDDAVPLESILRPDPQLRQLLEDIDKTKVKLWLFTNAYVTHGKRVVRTLGIEDLFEGITYSDYARPPLICKPDPRSYARAMREAGVKESKDCFFVGKTITRGSEAHADMRRRFCKQLSESRGARMGHSSSC